MTENAKPETDVMTEMRKIVQKMREAFEAIIAIEGYGAPWIEAKTIAQKALEIALPDLSYDKNAKFLNNAARLREALERLRTWALMDLNENAIGMEETNYEKLVEGIIEVANAALAAPPRNCDLYATAEEATAAFARMCAARGTVGAVACVDCPYSGKGRMSRCRTNWLFAPAAQEGGDHADA